MSVKRFIIPALLGLASWLVADNLAQAGHGGGGHGGGGHGGGGHGGGGHMGGGHVGGGHYGGGFYGGGYGLGGYGYGLGGYGYGLGGLGYGYGGGLGGYGYGGGLGYGYGGMGSNYGYGNNYLNSGYGYGSPQYSFYPATGMAQQQQQSYMPAAPAIPPGAAQIRVLVPDPNAKVEFDGSPTQQTGPDRFFHTPALTTNSSYSYRIRATWTKNGANEVQERVVNVTPGQTAVADFR